MDWLNWNTGWWRGKHPEGDKKKWRYILWDLDASFGHYINYTGIPDTGPQADPCDPEALGDPGGQGHVPILNSLFDNDEFTADYINRYADLSHTIFSCDFMINHLDSLVDIIAPEMPGQVARWGGTVSGWEDNVQELRDFILERCSDDFVEGMEECYDVEAMDITIIIEGEVEVNSINLNPEDSPWTGVYYSGLPIELSANGAGNGLFNFYWEVVDGDLALLDPANPDIIFDLSSPITIIAHFDACASIATDDIVGPSEVEQGSIWQYTFPSDFTNTSEWTVSGGEILFTSSSENTIAVQWNYGTGEGQIVLTQYDVNGVLECLFVNIDITEVEMTALNDLSNSDAQLVLFPNPASTILNLVVNSEATKRVVVYDMAGKAIYNESLSLLPGELFSMNTSFMNKGIYIVRVETGSGFLVEKLTID